MILKASYLQNPMSKDTYLENVFLLERLHRMFLEILKYELECLDVNDLSNVQGIILYNIGDTELPVSAITSRGYYLGSNASYNLKKMLTNGYIEQKQSLTDRRSSYVKLSAKGMSVKKKLDILFDTHSKKLENHHLKMKEFLESGRLFESFWSEEYARQKRTFT